MTYREFVIKLLSPGFHAENVGEISYNNRLKLIAHATHEADVIKRALFYNKASPNLKSPAEYPIPAPENIDLLHAALGLFTEAGELLLAIARNDAVNVLEELGDIRWYYELASHSTDLTDEYIRQKNMEKLQKRFSNKFSYEEVLNRDLPAERKALEE